MWVVVPVVVVVVTLGVAEMVVRLVYEPPLSRRVFDPFAYRIPRPGLVERFRITNDEDEWVSFELNEQGMRGPAATTPVAADALTLVFLGGSTTENYRFNDEDTFPVLIGDVLEQRLGRPVRVFNAGMSGGTTSNSLARMQHQVLDLHPDLIVVMHAINDLISGFNPRYRADQRHLPPVGVSGVGRLYLLSWLRQGAGRQDFTTGAPYGVLESPGPAGPSRSVPDYADFPALGVFRRNLRSMAAIAAANDIPILFLTQGSMYAADIPAAEQARRFVLTRPLARMGVTPPDVESLARGMEAFNESIRNLPRSPLVNVHDLAGQIERSTSLFYDECHLTREGNRRVADLIAPTVVRVVMGGRPAG
jgi:lysophospholipase L1-like esterase